METVILSTKQTTRYSKPFKVEKGSVMVISSFNFACPVTDDVGDLVKEGDCAILHKLNIKGVDIPELNGCVKCMNGVLEGLDVGITSSEPVVHCGELWTHNWNNNISVLSVPGYYMFELCNEKSIGAAVIQIEELSLKDAELLPKPLFHGE